MDITIICVGHYYTQTNTNKLNKTYALLQTTGGKDEPNILCGNRNVGCSSQHCYMKFISDCQLDL